jgi:hypothetical protein
LRRSLRQLDAATKIGNANGCPLRSLDKPFKAAIAKTFGHDATHSPLRLVIGFAGFLSRGNSFRII